MKKYKILHEVKNIGYNKNSRLVRIIRAENGKRYKIHIYIPVSSSNDHNAHFWNGNEWVYVCGKYDTGIAEISPYESDTKLEYFMMEAYKKIINFIDCLED